jgi:deoxyadenosine/deoxycytidine kinase
MATFIGIAGTHSTGKSTLVKRVAEEAKNRGISVQVVSDTATKARDAGFPILKNHTFESTLWIMTSVIKAELEAALKADLVLVDRPVPDAMGYLDAALEATSRSITSDERAYLENLTKLHSSRYALLLKTRLDETIELGVDRDPDLIFRKEADRKIDSVLERLALPALNPNLPEATERLQAIVNGLR